PRGRDGGEHTGDSRQAAAAIFQWAFLHKNRVGEVLRSNAVRELPLPSEAPGGEIVGRVQPQRLVISLSHHKLLLDQNVFLIRSPRLDVWKRSERNPFVSRIEPVQTLVRDWDDNIAIAENRIAGQR